MSAPAIHPPSSSVSSSGHADGLGRRVLAFDRETGGMLERLYLRPELAAFEGALRGHVERLLALEDERFARPFNLERDGTTGELTLVSEFVAGSRLADLLETAHDSAFVPGVDVALGYLLEALPALSTFHSVTGTAHGLIDPTRTVITAAGQVVFLDCAFGAAIERLGLSPSRLWSELGIAAPPSAAHVRLDATADVAQVALSGIMLVLGRRLASHEYPDALPSLLMEVIEVAQIRRSSTFASSLQRILQRSLPLPGRRAFGTPDEVIVEVRQLVRREIGLDVCHQALIDFVSQMDAASLSHPEVEAPYSPTDAFDEALLAAGIELVDEQTDPVTDEDEDDEEPESDSAELEMELALDEPASEPVFASEAAEEPLSVPEVIEIDEVFEIDEPSSEEILRPYATGRLQTEEAPIDDPVTEPEPSYARTREIDSGHTAEAPEIKAPEPPSWTPPEPAPVHASGHVPVLHEPMDWSQPAAFAEPTSLPPPVEAYAASVESEPPEVVTPPVEDPPISRTSPEALTPRQAPDPVPPADAPPGASLSAPVPLEVPPVTPTEPASVEDADSHESASSRRRKRQQRSARARKDKLRSLTPDQHIGGAKPAPPPAPKPGAWMVSPEKAAAFETAVQDQGTQAPPAGAVGRPLVVPPPPTYPPPPPPPPAPPAAATPVLPVFNPPAPIQIQPKPIVAAASPPAVRPAPAPASGPVRIKTDSPAGYAPVRKRLAPDPPPDEIMAFRPIPFGHAAEPESSKGFPWKLAAAAVVIVAVAVVVGRGYIPSRDAVTEPETPVQAASPDPPPPTTESATGGDVVIETQPTGVRVLLDGKPVGESPLKLAAVSAGRHVITFVTSSGEFKRTIRVTAGKTLTLDVPLYSGWVAIFAPIILDVAENGQSIGTTEQNRLLLPPGPHKLTLSNRDLAYSTVKEVDIQAGEVYSVTLDPRGPVNFNAVPWGEVWLDNQKLGDTPIANFQVPLGFREFVFKHPQYGERRVSATIRAGAPVAVSVDFTKP
jgi:hypothetical protein